jgi:uncharacterized Fe-S cluster protein YjdI/CDGSH-type Zn-finger protein
MRRTYRGTTVEVTFDLDRCIHVGACLMGLPAVFDIEERPWIAPDNAPVDAVVAIVERCPSGALQYRRLDGGPAEHHPATVITPIQDGPLLVVGEISVRRPDGSAEVLPRATLCRCGSSASKPFCDNSHYGAGFRAPGEPLEVHLCGVRPAADAPIATAADPRRDR